MFNRILVAIDGSKMSEKALMAALDIAKERNSIICEIHVEKNLKISEGMPNAIIDRLFTEQINESENLLKPAITLAEKEGIEIEVQSVVGEPAIQIVKKGRGRELSNHRHGLQRIGKH
ncbi:universal stress protein [Neobacillus cucumis]|uniref:universal stress protein n=1 Tax=Neobacillus cucumis TaxID=1740721 RepID=UPI00203E9380|nr:universal stress protein [Neobacillus cucumis]